MKARRNLTCISLLSALAICLSLATRVQAATITGGSQSFGTLGPLMADGSSTGDINTAMNFSIGNLTSSPFNQLGIFVGMPQLNLQQITAQPVTFNITVGTSLSNFGSLPSEFGHFASTSITELDNSPGHVAFSIAGDWTPGTFFSERFHLPGEPLAADLTVSLNQDGGPGAPLSANLTFATSVALTEIPLPAALPLMGSVLGVGGLLAAWRKRRPKQVAV